MKDLKHPSDNECKFNCCKGIGRRVQVRLGIKEDSIRMGHVTHFNQNRLIIELDNKEGEICIYKNQIHTVLYWKDTEEERKIRVSKLDLSNAKANTPTFFRESTKESAMDDGETF